VAVVQTGVALSRAGDRPLRGIVISCGLAGGLRADVRTGSVLVPERVLRPDNTTLECDGDLVSALCAATRRLGLVPITAPMVTSTTLVHGSLRNTWAELGYAGVDMETGLILAPRVAAVRVVLDTPLRELSEDWLHPSTALLRPRNWPQALWLSREAPRCARLAAQIVRTSLDILPSS
jgi:hypothetical protein